MSFPKNFIWGVSASSYQIEGAAFEDGKGLSIWDRYTHRPGKIWNNHNGDVAADHYHRYKEDIALMKEIGVQSYQVSVSWPRVLPDGTGKVNKKGLDFYDRVIDELLNANILPIIEIYHWETPYELYCRGSWLNPDSPDWFADFTRVLVDKYSDRVSHWITMNEPQCFIGEGYWDATAAPGDKLGIKEVLRAGHHALLAHGKSVQAIRAYSKTSEPAVGIIIVGITKMPHTSSKEDIDAARQLMFMVPDNSYWENACYWNNTWWFDPVLLGKYPEDGLNLYGRDAPEVGPNDMKIISEPLDFIGTNIYHANRVRAGKDGCPEEVIPPPGSPISAMRWPIEPGCLYWGPKFFYERYKTPIMITESGMSNYDTVSLDGKVHDPQRIDFLQKHLLQLEKAIGEGADVRGYFQWSIMDNFEWAEGYKERFGLIYVDFVTQQRILKDSAHWYKKVIATNGEYIKENPFK
ncbi:MAG: GH1 family beta-glucosidase [Actinomycetota bacterium]|nr:GH1 family beta-glucosidase [Actinomycetota bacterium]